MSECTKHTWGTEWGEDGPCPWCQILKLEARVAELEGLLERVTEQLVARLGTNSSEWATVREVRQTLNR